MKINTLVSANEHFEDFGKFSMNNERSKNASGVIRAGLRLLEEEVTKAAILKKAIDEGFSNGIAEDFDPKAHLAALKSGRKQRT